MSDPDTRDRRERKMKRNPVARVMNENRGAFAIKTINPKKTEYKRINLNVKDIDDEEEDS